MELAGEVVAVGARGHASSRSVTRCSACGGTARTPSTSASGRRGALAHKPAGMSFEEAAAVSDGACIALACLQRADLREAKSILVYGASGSIGTAAVQLAKAFGAHVTAVCARRPSSSCDRSAPTRCIDYTQEDFTKNGETYDVVFDAVGKHSFRRCRRSLKPGGIYIETDLGFMWHVPALALLTRWIGDKRVTLPIPKYTKEDVLLVKELIEAGEYRRGHRPDVSRSKTSSRRRGTSRRGRRPETSS